MKAYAFSAALLCETCGKSQIDGCDAAGIVDSDDSSDYPQGPYVNGGGEADCPQHCDVCHVFLENPLTADGVAYVREAISNFEQHGQGSAAVIQEWREFYSAELEPEALDEFTAAYFEAAMFTGVEPPEGHELAGRDKLYDLDTDLLTIATREQMVADCKRFQEENRDTIQAAIETGNVTPCRDGGSEWTRAGHDFWLSRNNHGAGFWDGDWPEPFGDILDKAAEAFGEYDLSAEAHEGTAGSVWLSVHGFRG